MSTTTRTEARIVAIRPAGPPEKRNFPFAITWVAPVTYELEDGTEIDGTMSPFTRKKDAVARAAARDGITNMVAEFDDGKFISTTTTYGIGR